ncbi:ABC transporter permease [Kroppenstedtia pulmonis]|uniref:ABC transporter permease n=1 Tax=Kroppenstedtia pulmonis TaxID=1380685 RepID=A0A7D4CH07_9BACL|nr:ABC transporter permease [Kroppenstedtia pulmonis]QKG85194.1 ABC transporter permease [Kroppenstedtia pulmonis]
MSNFIRLIQNENMKIYRRVGTWVMIGLLLLAALGQGVIMKHSATGTIFGKGEVPDWKVSLEKGNQALEKDLKDKSLPANIKEDLKESYELNQYRLDNDIPPLNRYNLWGYMYETSYITSLITLFTIIIGATSVAGEFSWGTIKLLLIRSASRSKILLSKYVSILFFALTLLVILFLFSLLVGSVLYGFDNLNSPYLSYEKGEVIEKSMPVHVLSLYALKSVDLLMMVTFAFMISSVFRSSSLAIGLAIFLMFTGVQAVFIMSQLDLEWAKYILFANTDLSPYFDGKPMFKGMTLSFSVTVLAIYFALFNAISWLAFCKRDVAS